MLNAEFITVSGKKIKSAPRFKKNFTIKEKVSAATLQVTCYGVYEAMVNGEVVSWFMAPGWTSYETRLQVQKYDITKLLSAENEINITVGDGWAMSRLAGWSEEENSLLWADKPAIIAQIDIEYENGEAEQIVTDESWQFAYGPYKGTEIYDGETYDSTVEFSGYKNAVFANLTKDNLICQQGEETAEIQRFKVCEIIKTPKGETVLDFGQNITGYLEFNISAPRGSKVYMTCAEVLDSDGNFYNENYRSARSAFEFIANGENQTHKCAFNFYGFRYIRLDEYPAEVKPENFTAIAVSSKMERTGYFECSSYLVNKLFSNIIWGQLSNYLDVPTDCPQRDERLGWTGDAQAFVRTGSYNFNVEKFFEKWLSDVYADQKKYGMVSNVIPAHPTNKDLQNCACGWGDVATIAPWQMYLTYGNVNILKNQFDSMKRWVDYITSQEINGEHLWQTGPHFGDWLALDAGDGTYVGATDIYYIASAFYANSVSILIKAYNTLINSGEEISFDLRKYETLYKLICADFKKKYLDENSMPKQKTQTAYVLAIQFKLTDDISRAADELAKMIKSNGGALQTGFLGTPYLLHVLSENGHESLAYDLLLREEYPSWLFSVKQGATTMWEHWDGKKQDGTFWSEDMNSFNHYAYGAVGDWLYGAVLGINPTEDGGGFKKVEIKPVFTDKLDYAKGSVKTKHGIIRSAWKKENGSFKFNVHIPKGIYAKITVGGKTVTAEEGGDFTLYA